MTLFRRGMKVPRTIEPASEFPEFMSRVHALLKGTTQDQNAALICAIHEAECSINRKLEKIMTRLEDLLDAVAAQQTQIDSLITLVGGMRQQVIEAMGSTITPSQQMRIDQVFEAVRANADDIAAAIKENTVEATSGAISPGPDLAAIRAAAPASTVIDPVAPVVDPTPAVGDLPDGTSQG
jgi:hypothetical protein